ncbi:zinc finger protein, putative [Bodo saltans]|uniref:Palmitoyltransferase n=1 Tax=Bodo saltans TaxID=75058 RepID=A0A0S4IWS3_BODSA|nr:zinc finger protein, putative [Bodo saltans]|eukprot:CUG06383.1 zinc finger protein, putative [Bodo saltans]
MGRNRRRFLKFNIPMFLNVIIGVYLYLSFAFFEGDMLVPCILSFFTTWSLYMASLSHPGPVHQWAVDDDVLCKHCGLSRPPRAHHCRRCDECIDRYDHHCDWIDNCVGRRNYKAFVLFLVYINACILHYYYQLGMLMNSVTCLKCPKHQFHVDRSLIVHGSLVFMYTFTVIPCWILALIFLFKTIFNALRNVTTYEEHVRTAGMHSKGWRGNLVEVFGRNAALWWIPTMVDDQLIISRAGGIV